MMVFGDGPQYGARSKFTIPEAAQNPQTPGTDIDIESIGDDDTVSVAGTHHSYNYNVTTGRMEQETLEDIPNYKRETLEAVIQESGKQASGRDVINQLKDFG